MKYMPHLDSLRALACMFVIFQHWFFEVPLLGWFTRFELGKMGVLLFFVLSGFLITQILLASRSQLESGNESLSAILCTFYVRRSLRIFPIYYLTVFVFYFRDFNNIADNFTWYALYSSNILTYINQKWDGATGPYWSLAVEEQFYLLWPILILTCHKTWLKRILLISILLGPLARLIAYLAALRFLNDAKISFGMVLMPACMDSFAMGALLAYARLDGNERILKQAGSKFILIISGLISMACLQFKDTVVFLLLFPLAFSLFALCLIENASKEDAPTFTGASLLFNELTRQLGKVSYGLYLYHCCIWWIFGNMVYLQDKFLPHKLSFLRESSAYSQGTWNIIQIALLLFVTTSSWLFIEKQALRLKSFFSYRGQ